MYNYIVTDDDKKKENKINFFVLKKEKYLAICYEFNVTKNKCYSPRI